MATYAKNTVGADSLRRTTYKEFPLATVERGEGNKVMVYGVCAAGAATGACGIDLATGAITDAGTGYVADAVFAAGEYGWVVKADLT